MVTLDKDILPIFIMKGDVPSTPVSFHGTGFIIAPRLLITCWHCVSTPLQKNCRYAAVIKINKNEYRAIYLSNIEKDANGMDLATANLNHSPAIPLKLSLKEAPMGTNILTFGYPLTDERQMKNGLMQFQLNGRYMEGYIMRDFYYAHTKYGKVASYELNFQVPEGLSGSPLIKMGSKEVIGVIYGSNEVAAIDEFASIDPISKERKPEIQKLIQFGLAHYTTTLQNVVGTATDNKPLIDYIEQAK